ncbi:hypothetical protein WJU16_22690 [Chitinophaga pollutisoli]|uniref:Uncharacterized protein n=1 Tax=Chitinophaga pollutisoli TaxID=3133966 RepID=A0ABZ2YMN3_9BACT
MANLFSPAFMVINGISLAILAFSFFRPARAAYVLGILFLFAAVINIVVLTARPEAFLELSAVAVYDWYIRAMDASFRFFEQGMILAITLGQLMIAAAMFGSGRWRSAGLACALVFFLAIAPLGAGAAFPSPVILAGACLVILLKTNRKQLAN